MEVLSFGKLLLEIPLAQFIAATNNDAPDVEKTLQHAANKRLAGASGAVVYQCSGA